jgi:hypothetical protein
MHLNPTGQQRDHRRRQTGLGAGRVELDLMVGLLLETMLAFQQALEIVTVGQEHRQ